MSLIHYNSGSGRQVTAFPINFPLHFRIEEGTVCSSETDGLATCQNTKCHNTRG